MDIKAAYASILKSDANNLVNAPETRAALKQASEDLKAGRISLETAQGLSFGATAKLIRAFQTGEAFGASVPSETIEARKGYLSAQIDTLLPKLRNQGLGSALAALEGARASGDWAAIGNAYVQANGESGMAEIDAQIRERARASGII